MFPTFVSLGALEESTTTLQPTAGGSRVSGDYDLLLLETADEIVSLTTAAGYTQHPGSPVSAPSGTLTIATRLTVFERIWDGSAGDPTTNDPGNHCLGCVLSFRRSSGTWAALSDVRSAVDGTGWKATAETVEDTSGSMDGITTDTADQLIIGCIAAAKPDVAGGTAEMSAITNANLATITERQDDAAASGNGGWIGAWTGEEATSGQAIGATTWTKASASYKAMLEIAIRDSAPGVATTPRGPEPILVPNPAQVAAIERSRRW
jgi:hypothetical protein